MQLIRLAALCKTFPRLCFINCSIRSFIDFMPMLEKYLAENDKEARFWARVARDEKDNLHGVSIKLEPLPPSIRVEAYELRDFPKAHKRFREEHGEYEQAEKKAREDAVKEEMDAYGIEDTNEAEKNVEERVDSLREY